MPYASNADLPKPVRDALPDAAQAVFRRVANSTLAAGDAEESAMAQAWGAVKRGWEKGSDGAWTKIQKQAAGLYVHRPVLNSWQIIDWAKDQGLRTTLDPQDLHVTVIYSDTPFDWPVPDTDTLVIRSKLKNETREVRVLGGDAICLVFDSPDLQARFDEMVAAGAVSSWGSYLAHITLTYDPGNITADMIEPYGGRIELGGEVYGEPESDWADGIVEKALRIPALSGDVRELVEKYAGPAPTPIRAARALRKRASAPDNRKPFEIHGTIAKAEIEKGRAFGFASVCKVGDALVIDGEEDSIQPGELEDAAYGHVEDARIADENHDGSNKGSLIESFFFTPEKCAAMVAELAKSGIAATIDIPAIGWWLGHRLTDEVVKSKVKSGEYSGFSIGGKAVRTARAA